MEDQTTSADSSNSASYTSCDDDRKKSLYPLDDMEKMKEESAMDSSLERTFSSMRSSQENMSITVERSLNVSGSDSPASKVKPGKVKHQNTKQGKDLRRRPIRKEDKTKGIHQTIVTLQTSTNTDWKRIIVALASAILIIIISTYLFTSTSDIRQDLEMNKMHLSQRELMSKAFMKDIKELMVSFPSQSKRLWAMIASAIKSVLRTETPSKPGILLLASSEQGRETMRCLSKRISQIVMKVYNDSGVTSLDAEDHQQLNGAELKLMIDQTMQECFSVRQEHLFTMHSLEKVSGKAAMMFHGYCDNDSAPFKDAVIIFTMLLEMSESSLFSVKERQLEDLVEARLQTKWENDIGYENTMALKSRVANSIGIVKAESSEISKC